MIRPLRKTYDPVNPFVAERHDQEDGSIVYEVWDHRPESYRRLCNCAEDYNDGDPDTEPNMDRGQAKKDADMIATALNMVYGTREFKSAKLRTIQPASHLK